MLTALFLVGGAAQADLPLGRKGGTPAQGWRHCPRHGARPFWELYAPPHSLLKPQCEAPAANFVGVLYR